MKIKIDNFEIYKLKQAGLSNQQVLKSTSIWRNI